MDQESLLRNREQARQIQDFSGLRFGAITPTDIDAFLDFGDRLFVFVEAKHGKAVVRTGQRLALERLCDASEGKARKAYVLVVSHNVEPGADVDLGAQEVARVYFQGKWKEVPPGWSLRRIIEGLLKRHGVAFSKHKKGA